MNIGLCAVGILIMTHICYNIKDRAHHQGIGIMLTALTTVAAIVSHFSPREQCTASAGIVSTALAYVSALAPSYFPTREQCTSTVDHTQVAVVLFCVIYWRVSALFVSPSWRWANNVAMYISNSPQPPPPPDRRATFKC